jgi:hypothetical protein
VLAILCEAEERYKHELMDDEERMMLLDRIKRYGGVSALKLSDQCDDNESREGESQASLPRYSPSPEE